MQDVMPSGTQAFLVLQGDNVVNKIVPNQDPVSCYQDIQTFYADPSYSVRFFSDPNDPGFVGSNNVIQGD